MGLLEEFMSQKPKQHGPRCRLGKLLESLDADTAAELAALLAMDTFHTDMARFVSAKWPDYEVKDGTVSRHRAGECSCDPV